MSEIIETALEELRQSYNHDRKEILGYVSVIGDLEEFEREFSKSKGSTGERFVLSVSARWGLYLSVIVSRIEQVAPLLHWLAERGWRQERARQEWQSQSCWCYKLAKSVPELEVPFRLNFNVYFTSNESDQVCRYVKVGEREEVTRVPVYKLICPESPEIVSGHPA